MGYFKRRIRRIYPPLWAMLVLQVAIVCAIDVFLFRGLLTNSIAPMNDRGSSTCRSGSAT